jgi:hypothetical protein
MELLTAYSFYHIEAVKQVHYMTLLLSFLTLFCYVAVAKSTARYFSTIG